jgi:tetratricopeptide (TPR) repeat protein
MALLDRPLRHRGVLVALWLGFAVEFLWWKQPGFWQTPFLAFDAARRLADEQRDLEAIEEMKRAVSQDARNAGFLAFKGYLELRSGRVEDALESFTRGMALRPDDIETLLGLAEANVRLGRETEARTILEALNQHALTLEQRYRRQTLFGLLRDFDAALADAALLDTDLMDATRLREGLHWAASAGAWDRTIALADRVLASTNDPTFRGDAIENKAAALDALGRSVEALALYSQNPTPQNLEARARLSLQLNQYEQAAKLLNELLTERPTNFEVARQLAYALEKTGRLQEAISTYRDALEHTDEPDLRVRLAAVLNGAREYDSAWAELSALPKPSDEPPVLRLQVQTAFWSGRLLDAAALLDFVSPLGAEDVTLASDLAWALTDRGQGPAGERVYRRLLDENRATPAVRERYAWWLNEQRRYDEAWALVRAVPRAELGARGLELQARTAFWAGDYQTAAPLLELWLRDQPSNADVWRDLAEAARQRRDAPTELRALDRYAALRPDDTEAALRRAGLLEQAGRTDEAISTYAAVLAQSDRVSTRRVYAYLLERAGRIDEAIPQYETVWLAEATRAGDGVDTRPRTEGGTTAARSPAGPGGTTADLSLTIARLLKSRGRAADALVWYDRASSASGPIVSVGHAIEIAQTEIDAGRPEAARARVEALVRAGQANAELLAYAASVAASLGDPAAAAGHLEALRARQPLTGAQLYWQAGLYRAAGDRQRALAVYDRMVAARVDEAIALEAIGDVHVELHDLSGALAAWSRARAVRPSPPITLKMARLQATLGQMDDAVTEYERYLATERPDGLRVELARTYLGASQFDKAEHWAREATESYDERGISADLVLAQALYLLGHIKDSYALNDGRPTTDQITPALLEQFGQLAAARNRHLYAIKLFDQALAAGSERPQNLWMWSAQSAYWREDYFRSTSRLARASAGDDTPPFARRVGADLDKAVAPAAGSPMRVFGDSNDLSIAQAGIQGLWQPNRLFNLTGEATFGTLSQRQSSYERTRAVVGVSRALVTPTWGLSGDIGGEHYSQADSLIVGSAGVTKYFEDNSTAGVRAYRQSFWSPHDLRDPRQFNRVLDLAALGPAFHVNGVSGFLDHRTALMQQAFINAGFERFQDDNTHQYAYGQYQFVLKDRPGRWSALAPNVFWERFDRGSPLYFSPSQYVWLGGVWHEIHGRTPWRMEAEINPRLTVYDSRAGFAINGALDASREFGPVILGGGAFLLYDDRSDYWAWRLAGQVGLRLGR